MANEETIDVKPVPMIGQLLDSGKVQTTIFGDRVMPKQLYDARELTPEWKKARERTISYCKSKNHSESSIDNARRISNVVATNMTSLGVNSAARGPMEPWLVDVRGSWNHASTVVTLIPRS